MRHLGERGVLVAAKWHMMSGSIGGEWVTTPSTAQKRDRRRCRSAASRWRYFVGNDGRRDTQGTRVLVAAHPVIREADSLRAHEILHAHGRALMVLGEYGAAREVLGRAGRPPLGSSRFPSRASPSWTSGGRRPEAYAGGIEAVRRGDGQANEHCLVTLALIEAGLGQERDCREHAR